MISPPPTTTTKNRNNKNKSQKKTSTQIPDRYMMPIREYRPVYNCFLLIKKNKLRIKKNKDEYVCGCREKRQHFRLNFPRGTFSKTPHVYKLQMITFAISLE